MHDSPPANKEKVCAGNNFLFSLPLFCFIKFHYKDHSVLRRVQYLDHLCSVSMSHIVCIEEFLQSNVKKHLIYYQQTCLFIEVVIILWLDKGVGGYILGQYQRSKRLIIVGGFSRFMLCYNK